MTNGLNEVILKLEQQRTAIERALAALRDIQGTEVETAPVAKAAVPVARAAAPATGTPAKAARKGGMTAEGRKRLSEALKARWAAKRAPGAPSEVPAKAARKGGGMTPEGRKRLSDALRKRWAAKRASAAVSTKRGRK